MLLRLLKLLKLIGVLYFYLRKPPRDSARRDFYLDLAIKNPFLGGFFFFNFKDEDFLKFGFVFFRKVVGRFFERTRTFCAG